MHVEKATLFNNVPRTNLLHLFDEGAADVNRTKDFLNLTKKDVAAAAQTPESSVRFDERMPEAVRLRMNEIACICELVAGHFNSAAKAALWFKLPNPMLGDMAPRDLLRMGRFKNLHRFVNEALSGL